LYKRNNEYRSLRELDLSSSVVIDGKICGTIKQCFEYFFLNHLLPFFQTKKRKEIMDLFKTVADIKKEVYIESEHTFPGVCARLFSGEEVDISFLKFIIFGTRSTKEVEQKHYKFNEMMISAGEHLDSDGSKIKFNIVQEPGTKKIHGCWYRETPKNI
jgi:hypothetical protein